MMALPPGEPTTPSRSPVAALKMMVGAMELRGRLPACTLLAMGLPAASVAVNEKSVSWLFSKKPRTICRLPKPFSMVVVMDTALPALSMMDMCVVDGRASELSLPVAPVTPGGMPATGTPMLFCRLMSLARSLR
ncbi:hypothetical protein D3C72_1955410 [compost metagenome]